MENLGTDVASVLTSLMPGFIFAWVFYSLTTHRKPTQFDQVVYALIATTALHAVVVIEGVLFLRVGRWWAVGPWNADAKLLASVVTAVLAGFGVAQLARQDAIFGLLRKLGLTTRNHNSSEWCTVFEKTDLHIVLHLKSGRRIYGWPYHWPSDHKKGHFYLVNAEWLDEGNSRYPLHGVEGILISVEDVEMVECVKGGNDDEAYGSQAHAGNEDDQSREREYKAGADSKCETQPAPGTTSSAEEVSKQTKKRGQVEPVSLYRTV